MLDCTLHDAASSAKYINYFMTAPSETLFQNILPSGIDFSLTACNVIVKCSNIFQYIHLEMCFIIGEPI